MKGGRLMKKVTFVVLLVLLVMSIVACGSDHSTDAQGSAEADLSSARSEGTGKEKENKSMKIQIAVGDAVLTATPENNPSAEAFLALLQEQPITVEMSDYAGMEKVGSLGTSLTRSDSQISVGAGDVVLYQGNQITIYYGTNSWNFTKLAHIEGATKENLLEVLGAGNASVVFSIDRDSR